MPRCVVWCMRRACIAVTYRLAGGGVCRAVVGRAGAGSGGVPALCGRASSLCGSQASSVDARRP
jgi:hypothetical protein